MQAPRAAEAEGREGGSSSIAESEAGPAPPAPPPAQESAWVSQVAVLRCKAKAEAEAGELALAAVTLGTAAR